MAFPCWSRKFSKKEKEKQELVKKLKTRDNSIDLYCYFTWIRQFESTIEMTIDEIKNNVVRER